MRKSIRTEHAGGKNGGGFWGKRVDAKHVSNRVRRSNDRVEANAEVITDEMVDEALLLLWEDTKDDPGTLWVEMYDD